MVGFIREIVEWHDGTSGTTCRQIVERRGDLVDKLESVLVCRVSNLTAAIVEQYLIQWDS